MNMLYMQNGDKHHCFSHSFTLMRNSKVSVFLECGTTSLGDGCLAS